MSPNAYTQFAPQLKPGGILLYEKELIALDDKLPTGVKAFGVPATRFAEELGRRLVLNIVMTGFFTGVTGVVSFDAAEKAVKSSVPKGTEDLNLRAFRKGYEYGRDQVAGGN
jgi:2-oxoglutarate ferredoxin oxidoreductase subunit gamma